MDLFYTFATDETAELEGVPVDFGDGFIVTIARSDNDAYTNFITSEYDKFREVIDSGSPQGKETDQAIMRQAMAMFIIRGWDGATFKGKKFPYSVENAMEALKMKDFRRKVLKHAMNEALYRVKKAEEDKKK